MSSALEALREALADWITGEEATISRLAAANDPTVSTRLELWTERLQAYERVERALAARQRLEEQIALPTGLPEAIERGLMLVP
jgi:hypothetical protein